MNKAILIGNVVRDIELRQTQSGKSVTDFTLAINNGKNKQADFINCQAWERTAEILNQYASKGTKLAVEGSIKTTSYTNKEGIKIYKTFVQVYQTELLGSKSESNYSAKPNISSEPAISIDNDDLPF